MRPLLESSPRVAQEGCTYPVPVPNPGQANSLDLRGVSWHRGRSCLLAKIGDYGVPHLPVIDNALRLLRPSSMRCGRRSPLRRSRPWIPCSNATRAAGSCPGRPHPIHIELDVFVSHRLHGETHSGDGGHRLAQLQLVQDGCLAGRVQAQRLRIHALLFRILR